ncbi:MAG: hypothetical protein BWY09_01673 [Candidatus Hydrogenedentes bacterium ADurb.Bin179]|nr:MAG: hypothetical protein BWY09_01673 [Candidatus Hydrogenedentes bacterium ADurb.Bin179]
MTAVIGEFFTVDFEPFQADAPVRQCEVFQQFRVFLGLARKAAEPVFLQFTQVRRDRQRPVREPAAQVVRGTRQELRVVVDAGETTCCGIGAEGA